MARSSKNPISKQSKINNVFAILLVILIAIAPIPLGSNRPIFWAISGFLIALMMIIYLFLLYMNGSTIRHGIAKSKWLVLLFFALLFYIILQIIPFNTWVIKSQNFAFNALEITSKTISIAPSVSFLSLIQFASYGLLFFFILQLAHNTERARLMLVSLFVMVVLYACYSLFALTQLGDPILFMTKWAYAGNATSTFVNRNSFATFLSFGLIIGSAFAAFSFSQKEKGNLLSALLYILGVAIIIAALFATQSRMGFAAGVVGALITIILVTLKAPRSKLLLLPVLLFALIAISILTYLYGQGLLDRLGSTESALDGRMLLYSQIVTMISSRPFLGFGAGSFELIFPLFHQLPLSPDVVWDLAHNSYLALWAELGVIFGSIPIILVVLIVIKAIKNYRKTQYRWLHSAITLGVVITAAMHSLVDFSLEIQAIAYLFVAILALGVSGSSKSRKNNKNV